MSMSDAPAAATGDEKPDTEGMARKHRWFRAFETNKRREMDEARGARRAGAAAPSGLNPRLSAVREEQAARAGGRAARSLNMQGDRKSVV